MSGEARVPLHLDLNTSDAQRKQDNFISQNKNLKANLALDISQAMQNFQDFAAQIQNQAVRAQLLLDGTETPQAVTSLKLITDEAQTSLQNFIAECQNQHAELKLSLDSEQIQKEINLNFDTAAAQVSFGQFVSYVNSQTVSAVLKLDTSPAETALHTFLVNAGNQTVTAVLKTEEGTPAEGTAVLHLDTSAAKTEFADFITYLNSQNPEIQLHLNADNAEQDLQNIHNQTKQLSPLAQKTTDDITKNISSISSLLTRLSGIIGTVFSVSVIHNFVKEAKAAWNIQLEAETKLENILGRNLGATQAQIQATKEWASALQSVGVIGDEVQLSGLQELSTYIENADSLRKMNVVLNDMLAQQYGLNATAESAVTISTMLGKVLQGQTAALSRYGYFFTEAQEKLLKYGTEEQRVATLAEVVEASVGGMNEALASTPAGKLKQLENYLGDIKEEFGKAATNLQVLFLPALQRAADLLNAVALKAIEVSEILADMFGVDLSGNFTGAVAAAVTEADNLTESAENTQKVIEDTIDSLGQASFDDFNIIGVPDTDTESDSDSETEEPEIAPVLNPSGIQQGISEIEKQFSEKLKNLFQPFLNAWETWKQPLLDSMANAGEQIKSLFGSIGQSLEEVWTNGTGERAVSSILEIFRNIYDIIGNISERFALAWNAGTGTSIVQHLADIFQNVLDTVNHITAKTAEFAGKIDFSPFLKSVDGLLESLEPFTEHIGEGLEWFWEHVLLPVAGFTIENLIPDFLNILSGAIEILDASIEALKPFGLWLWEEFIKPLADWSGEIITAGLKNLADVLHNIGDWIRENPEAAVIIGGLTAAFIGLRAAVTGGAFTSMAAKIAAFAGKIGSLNVEIAVISAGFAAWGYVITELSKNLTDICDVFEASGGEFGFISGWLEYVREDVEEFFSFGDFGEKWLTFWESAGEVLYTFTHDIWEGFLQGIKEKFASVRAFLKEWAFEPFMDSVRTLFGIHSPSTVMAEIGGYLIDGLYNAVSDGIRKIKEIFELMLLNIESVFGNLPDWFGQKFTDTKEKIQQAFQNFSGFFSEKWESVKEVFSGTESYFSDKFSHAYEKIRNAFSGVGEVFSQIWESIKSPFEQTADWFREVFSNAWEAVKQVFSSGGTVFQGIQAGIDSTFRNVVNSLIDGINSVVKTPFQGISEALNTVRGWWLWTPWGDFYPFENLPEISIPEIPHLATGGIVRQPTLAMVGDNPDAQNDPEIISPLSKLKSLLPEQGTATDTRILESKLDTLIQLAEILIDTVSENQPVVRIGDKEIYSASERGRRKYSHMKGML